MTDQADPLSMSADELDVEIGRALLSDTFGSKDVSEAEARATARQWLELNLANLRVAVCRNSVVREQLMGKTATTRNELLAAVVDTLLKLGGIGAVPVAVLGARLLHFGIEKLCGTPATGS